MAKLAINGGARVRSHKFPSYNTMGDAEKSNILDILEHGVLSRYLGAWHKNFYGGDAVQELEKEWSRYFGVRHAIAVNSATSGLYCAVGAINAGLGDEIIVSPYTMSASAIAPLVYNSVPIFADIEEEYLCLDADSILDKITERTKAIIVVDLFGQPYDADTINEIAKNKNLFVIEDAAQAPGAKYKGRFAGTLGDIGVFSLNYHKHIHSGEGGIVVTENDDLADRIRLIRNHAESVVENKGTQNIENLIGFNYRMTELQASIALAQLGKLEYLLESRRSNINYLNKYLGRIPFINPMKERNNSKHSYYVHPFIFDEKEAGVHRNKFIDAVKAELEVTRLREDEGVKIASAYVSPLYLLPLFQNRTAYNKKGFPWDQTYSYDNSLYAKGICPVCEAMYNNSLFFHELMHSQMSSKDLDDVINAFMKVFENISELH